MKTIFTVIFFAAISVCHSQEQWTVESDQEFQNTINREYSNKDESPLLEKDFKEFKSLDFFPINKKYAVIATFVRSKNETVFKMKTTGERMPEYIKYGELHFVLEGKSFKLNVYQNIELSKRAGYEDYLFLPFSDLTCGKESYIGGRYIDLRFPKSDKILLDFNKAYNPYCAYSYRYSCPIVPLENDLNIEILAGVKKFHD